MPGSPGRWGELTDEDYELIKFVVGNVLEFGRIPGMEAIAERLGITRQGVLVRMRSAERRGILRPRPKYATNWLELTPLGEDRYRERAASDCDR